MNDLATINIVYKSNSIVFQEDKSASLVYLFSCACRHFNIDPKFHFLCLSDNITTEYPTYLFQFKDNRFTQDIGNRGKRQFYFEIIELKIAF